MDNRSSALGYPGRSHSKFNNVAVMEMKSNSLKRSFVDAVKVGLVSILLTSILAIASVLTLPQPEAGASQSSRDSFAIWKESHYASVAFVALFEVPVIVAAAHFASTFPPYPMRFWVSLGIVALAAAIAHVATTPLKGPPSLANKTRRGWMVLTRSDGMRLKLSRSNARRIRSGADWPRFFSLRRFLNY